MLTDKFGHGRGIRTGKAPNDDVSTPPKIARMIVERFPIEGKTLDPFRGNGAFYDCLPGKRDWCEIKEDRDFFEWKERVDWIVSNPPYSTFDQVLAHSFEVADNVLYLLPLSKVVSSMRRIRAIEDYGGVKEVFILSASKCGFPFGFPACAIWFKRGYKGETKISIDKKA